MTVTERVRELGLLRAAGATRRQVGRFVIVQALILGLAGSVVGLAVGIALAELMAVYVRSIGSIPFERVGSPAASAIIAHRHRAVRHAGRVARACPSGRLDLAGRGAQGPARSGGRPARAGCAGSSACSSRSASPGCSSGRATPGLAGLARAGAVYALLLVVVLASPFLLGALARVAGLPFAPSSGSRSGSPARRSLATEAGRPSRSGRWPAASR